MLAEKEHYPIALMARILEVSRSGFYSWIAKGRLEGEWTDVKAKIKRIWEESDRRFGFRFIHACLPKDLKHLTLYRVRKCMRELGICGCTPYKSKRTTVPNPNAKPKPDLMHRDFTSPVPTYKLVGGYNVSPHRARLALSFHRHRSKHTHGGGLVAIRAHDRRHCCGCPGKCQGARLCCTRCNIPFG